MVFLALTRQGLLDAIELSKGGEFAVWCTADAISEDEFNTLKVRNVTRFIYALSGVDDAAMADALCTIEDHHPGERIWIEGLIRSNSSLNPDDPAGRRLA